MMRCSRCATNNPSTNNFCAKCGNALVRRCARCAAENPPTADFCGKCGARLGIGDGASAGDAGEPNDASGLAPGVQSRAVSAKASASKPAYPDIRVRGERAAGASARAGETVRAPANRSSETAEADGDAGSPRTGTRADVLNPAAPSVRVSPEGRVRVTAEG